MRLTRRSFVLGAGLCGRGAQPGVSIASFRADVTPALGEPLIWTTPLSKVEDPLWGKGVVIESGRRRLVLCTLDWCGLGGAAVRLFQTTLAQAAGTDPLNVVIHAVHQHAAPYVDGDACALLRKLPDPPLLYSEQGLREAAQKLARALTEALGRLQPVDAVGLGQAKVERVASSRRVWDKGKLVVRYSTGGKDPYQAALPEGRVDPWLRTLTLAQKGRPLVRLHFYATHPQTFCCDGRASADFVGEARETLERDEKVFQLYFTGCAGDVTVGKYNDGTDEARRQLAKRLAEAMRTASGATAFQSLSAASWKTMPVRLRARQAGSLPDPAAAPERRYRAACALAYAQRREPLYSTVVKLGPARLLYLPGEPMLEFQEYAGKLAAGRLVAVAGYTDIGCGYICTDQALQEGGYEPGASHLAPGAERELKRAIRAMLAW